jgi:ribosomal protein S18 acetylase RimI-like enzyme
LAAVRDELIQYNLATVGETTHYPVVFHLRGDSGEFQGGITGDVWLDRLSIEFLWIEESLRGQGHGRRLLEAAERYGVECGATHAHLDTYDFQAGPRYYERLGYEVFGVLGEAPEPISYFMQKRLVPGVDRQPRSSVAATGARPSGAIRGCPIRCG